MDILGPVCMAEEPPDAEALLRRAAAGDLGAWGALLVLHESRLCRMVSFRMDPRLRGRVDASDIVQEAYLEAAAHRDDFFRPPSPPLFLWLRGVVSNKLLEVHRRHLSTRMRDAAREVAPRGAEEDDSTSGAVINQLSGRLTGPRTAAAQSEAKARLRAALANMDPADREALALRHFEQLTNSEAAAVLGINERAAAKRYFRALRRLRDILSAMPGGLTEVRI